MSLSLSLTGFDNSNPIPGIYPEIRFAQGEAGGDLSATKVLILAPKTSAGAITADTEVRGPLNDEQDAIDAAGAGSPAHRMARRFLSIYKNAQVYLCCPAAASGSAAVDKATVTGTATANGVVGCVFAGQTIEAPIAIGDTPTVIAQSLTDAFNARTELPATAAAATGVVTITGKIAGDDLNSARFHCYIKGAGITSAITPTASTAFGASGASGAAIGAGTCTYTAALATVLATDYDYIVAHTQTASVLTALMAQVNTQAEPSTGFREKVIAGLALTPSAATTLATGINAARLRLPNQKEAPEEHYIVAAACAAGFCKTELSDPSYNHDGYGQSDGQSLGLQRPKNDSAIPTQTEIKLMLNNGVIPIAVNKFGVPYIVRSVTSRSKNGSVNDYRARDSIVVTVGDKFVDDGVAKLSAAPWKKTTEDPGDGQAQPNALFATPKRVKGGFETLVSDYVDAGYLDPAKKQTTLDAMQIGIDPQVPGRINIRVPIYSAVLLHQFGLLVAESSKAA